MDFDEVLPLLDGYGTYQKYLYVFIIVPSLISTGVGFYNVFFISGIPDHWCFIPELAHLPLEKQKNISLPLEKKNGFEKYSQCKMYDINYTQLLQNDAELLPRSNWSIIDCKHGWTYDKSVFRTTLVAEMDIVCDKEWMVNMAISIYYAGGIIGCLWFGFMADKWGRKIAFISNCVFYATISLIACFPPNYTVFIIYRFITGMEYPAFFQVPFVIAIEMISPEKRTRDGMLNSACFSVGLLLISLVAYAFQEWFSIALATSIPLFFFFIYFFFIPESPRWLISQHRYEEAEAIVQKIAKCNKRNIEKNFLKKHLTNKSEKNIESDVIKPSFLHLFKYPTIRKNFIIFTIDWVVSSFVHPLFSFGVSLLPINEYLGAAISSFVEIPGIIFSWIMMEKIGRKWSICINLGIGGLSCVCIAFLSSDYVWTMVILTNIGKFCISGAWAATCVYGCELFPTVLRNSALSAASLLANIVNVATPYLLILKNISQMLPVISVGVLCVISAILTLWLPETKNSHLPQTIEESESLSAELCCNFRRKKQKYRVEDIQNISNGLSCHI